jgi:hypothetical protein
VRDPGLDAYVEAIENHLSRRRGREHTLAPRDFDLARGWYVAGVSAADVLSGIDEAFAAGETVASLTFCRRFVEARVKPGRV